MTASIGDISYRIILMLKGQSMERLEKIEAAVAVITSERAPSILPSDLGQVRGIRQAIEIEARDAYRKAALETTEPSRRADSTRATVSGLPPVNPDDAPVPDPRHRPDGQAVDHWVLPLGERVAGFVRPLRYSYDHVGPPGPRHPLRDLTPEERERYKAYGYVAFEAYPDGYRGVATGRFWTQEQLDAVDKGCGAVTKMPLACAETYARVPGYYGSTWCCGCNAYLPVGSDGEFVWAGTDERVGT